MNTFDFINSIDIRDHLKNIGYKFTPLEAAWLVWQSKRHTLNEKHNAWQEIIDTMPDCGVNPRSKFKHKTNLHSFLKKLIEEENAIIDEFYKSENCVYMYRYKETGFDGWIDDFNMCFSKLSDCIGAIKKEADITRVKIVKRYIDDITRTISIEYSSDFEIMECDCNDLKNYENDWIFYFFGDLWFNFPVPFKKGDILIKCTDEFEEPFVLDDIAPLCPVFVEDRKKNGGDYTDMNAWGYWQEESGEIMDDVMWNYMDLEYYRGEFSGKRRILKGLSNFMKGEIDIGLYSRGYSTILNEEYAKEIKPKSYTEKGMELAGIIKDS